MTARIWTCLIATTVLLGLPGLHTDAARANEITMAEDGKRKINLAGRQRMLSQFMAKAACFAALSIRRDHHLQQMAQTHWMFDTTLTGLSKGSDVQAMLPERNETARAALQNVAELWADYGPAVQAYQTGRPGSKADLDRIFQLNVPVLKTMNAAVGVLEKVYSEGGAIDPGLALAINVSGRQRMLTQKASKEFCKIASGTDAEAARKSLAATVALFSRSLEDLISGNAELGIPAAPVSEIHEQLSRVRTMWQPLRDVFERVAGGAAPTAGDIALIANSNEPVLVEMNKAVFLYEAI